MKRQEFEQLVTNHQLRAEANPKRYLRRLNWFLRLGAIAFYLPLLLIASLVGLIVYAYLSGKVEGGGGIRVVIFLGLILVPLIQSLFGQISEPEGMKIDRAKFPLIYLFVDSVSAKIHADRIDDIYFNLEVNASAQRWRKFVLFGRPRLVLTLGVQLWLLLSEQELRACVGHELAHHVRGDTSRELRCVGVGSRWISLHAHLSKSKSITTGAVTKFLDWYSPRLEAMVLPAARMAEFDADALAGLASSKQAQASTLFKLVIATDAWLDPLTLQLVKDSTTGLAPRTYAELHRRMLSTPIDDSRGCEIWWQLIHRPDTIFDVHPPLPERLSALGYPSRTDDKGASYRQCQDLSEPEGGIAWDALQNIRQSLLTQLDHFWTPMLALSIDEGVEEDQETAMRLRELEEQASQTDLSELDGLEHALLVVRERGIGEGRPALAAFVQQFPGNKYGRYALALKMLELPGDVPDAVVILNEFIDNDDHEFAAPAAEALVHHYSSIGDKAAAQRLLNARIRSTDFSDAVVQEFDKLLPGMTIEPWDVDPKQRIELARFGRAAGKSASKVFVFRRRSKIDTRITLNCVLIVVKIGSISADNLNQVVRAEKVLSNTFSTEWKLFLVHDKKELSKEGIYPPGAMVWTK